MPLCALRSKLVALEIQQSFYDELLGDCDGHVKNGSEKKPNPPPKKTKQKKNKQKKPKKKRP